MNQHETQDQRLAVDIGNSGARVVRLPLDPQAPLATPLRINWLRFVKSNGQETYAPDDERWTSQLEPLIDSRQNTQWWISSVNRPATAVLQRFLQSVPCQTMQVVDYRSIPLRVDVDLPHQVGIDRLLAALAASRVVQQRPAIVIQAGSAVTVDLVIRVDDQHAEPNRHDAFQGGAILPGVPMILRLLGSAADLLPEVEASELMVLPPLPGRNTQAAMLAGASSSLVGGVRHLVDRYRMQYGPQVPIVLSGGDGPVLAPHLDGPIVEVPQLVLQGLRTLADSPLGKQQK
ncbi:MAG: type III pantothenate kinase [Pirellulaceae bacterium]|nr:type III pantothenate kinase [Pirellulaceae bacterium]